MYGDFQDEVETVENWERRGWRIKCTRRFAMPLGYEEGEKRVDSPAVEVGSGRKG